MNLDDYASFAALDSENVLADIENLPDELTAAWASAQTLDLPAWRGIQGVVIAAMGTSALAADLLAAYLSPTCASPLSVVRNYPLPAWANGPETLVICASYAGESEEPLSVFEQAVSRNCRVLALTGGGKLAAAAQKNAAALWTFEPQAQTGAAVAVFFALLLAVFTRLGLAAAPADELFKAVEVLKAQQASLRVAVPISQNEAKRLAGQCVGRWLTVFGADHLAPVARHWKIQLNLLAKTGAQFETLPEADHNTLLGVAQPEALVGQTMLLFLRGRACHPRNQVRSAITKEYFMLEGLGTDFFNAQGETLLAEMLTALHFGDYLAYYLAMAYGVDPQPLATVEAFKLYLAEAA